MIEKIKTLLKNLGFTVDGKTDAEILRVANEAGISETTVTPLNTTPAHDATPVHNRSIIEQQQQQIATLTTQMAELTKFLGDERTARENANKALQEQQETKRKAEIAKMIDDAVKVGKIPNNADAKSKWEKRFETSFEVSKDALAEIPENGSLVRQSGQSNNKPADGKSTTTVSADGTLNRTEIMRSASDFINSQIKK